MIGDGFCLSYMTMPKRKIKNCTDMVAGTHFKNVRQEKFIIGEV